MESLTLVLPAYNEATRLPRTIKLIQKAISEGAFEGFRLEKIWVIDDGSKDNTSEVAQAYEKALPLLSTHRVEPNQGKGNAIHEGLRLVKTEWCLIADADSATPWNQFKKLYLATQSEGKLSFPIAIGSRDLPESDIQTEQSWIREHMGKTFNFLVRMITGLPFKDTQCGFKLIHLASIRSFLPKLTVKRFAWDVEFLMLAKARGIAIAEVPVSWAHQEASHVNPIKDSSEMLFRVIQMRLKTTRILILVAMGLSLLLSGYFFFYVPTLDFDEALYRSVVEGMKASHDPWHLAWDGRILYHKPPILYWLIWFFSWIVDGSTYFVSAFAARLPSFFSTLGILVYLYRSGKRFETSEDQAIGKNAVLAFLCGLFPLLTATSVLFDPLQTLCFMPSLVVPALLFYNSEKVTRNDWALWSFSLFAASATKGLNGLIVPTFAFGVHALLIARLYGFKKSAFLFFQFCLRVFLPAVALTTLYYIGLNEAIGPAFTHEFIWIQHFQRGTSPMEQHSGSFFYHFWVIFLGGGVLIPLLFDRIQNRKAPFATYGFPLTYTLSFVLIFGLSATKLPHYSWPVWPALALYLGLISALPSSGKNSMPARLMGYFPLSLLGVIALGFACFPNQILPNLSHTQSFSGVVRYFDGFNGFETILFLMIALLCFGFGFFRTKFLKSFEGCTIISILIALCLSLSLSRTINNLMVAPFYKIAADLRNDKATHENCIRYSGVLSPTLSLALFPDLIHNRCEPGEMKYLIAPEWKAKECADLKFKVINQESYLILCKNG